MCAIDIIIHSHLSTVIAMGSILKNKLNSQKYPDLSAWYDKMNNQRNIRANLNKMTDIVDKKKFFGMLLESSKA